MAFRHAVKYLSSMLKYPATLSTITKMTLSVAIIVSASTVLTTINRSQRDTQTQHFFFIGNVMLANILAVTTRSVVAYAAAVKIMHPNINLIRCKALGLGISPVVASFLMVVALYIDRIFTVMAPGTYKKTITRILAITFAVIIWVMSCIAAYIWLSGFYLADEDGTCNTEYFEQFETKAIIFPMVISGVLAAIHNTFIFYKVFITTTLDPRLSVRHNYRFARLCKAWRMYKETQPISITLLILGVYNIAISIMFIPTGLVQSYAGEFLQDAISFCAHNIVDISMLIQSLLYVKFLHTIKERLWF